jgi:NADH-quinone oxidoreductase subunit N
MNDTFYTLLDRFTGETLKVSLPAFLPELVLCATVVVMLLARMPAIGRRLNAFWIALPGTLVALGAAAPLHYLRGTDAGSLKTEFFDGMLVFDEMSVFFRAILLSFAVLFLFFTKLSGIPDREDSPDFYTLVLGGTIGMCVMCSANHLLSVFLGVEMASVPSYALAGMLKGRRTASEAALKYAVYGAGAAGVMLYGISLLAGALGTVHIPTMAAQLAALTPEVLADRQVVLMSGGLLLGVGLAFKLSAVPFHFWAPDVFEGACAEVGAFLSVASKAAALALLLRVGIGLTHPPHAPDVHTTPSKISAAEPATDANAAVVSFASQRAPTVVAPGDDEVPAHAHEGHAHGHAHDHDGHGHDHEHAHAETGAIGIARRFAAGLIGLLAAITCTFGNLAAYGQTNIKRLLAYSTIAHAGYMMMPAAAAVALAGTNDEQASAAIGALSFYVGTYLFMNLGAFAVVAFLRNTIRSEEIADYAGLIKRSPGLVILFSAILLSLVGLPPLAGFPGKFMAFGAVYEAAKAEVGPGMYLLLFVGGINTAISLFYYLRVVKVMTLEPEPADRVPVEFSLISPAGVYLTLITLPVFVLGVWWDPLNILAQAAGARFFH